MQDYLRRIQEICQKAKDIVDKQIVIYGAGTNGVMIFNYLKKYDVKVYVFLDGRAKQEQLLEGIPVMLPDAFSEEEWKNCFVIVSTLMESYTYEINKTLQQHGLTIEKDFMNMCQEHFFDNAPIYKSFDPFLGYSKSVKQINSESKKIFILGNSTSYRENDGKSIFVEHTWADYLEKVLGREYQIFNCSFPAYTSAQELLKLIRDCIPYKPDIVISLNGLVDAEHVRTLPKYPFYTRYQKEVLECTFGRNREKYNGVIDMPDEIVLGEQDCSNYSDVYLRNIKMMSGICKSLNITYYTFLQPTLFGDNSCLNDEEIEMFEFLYPKEDYKFAGQSVNCKARRDAEHFFTLVKKEIRDLDFVFDLTEIFKGEAAVYKDARHYTTKGHEIIANRIVEILRGK